MMNAVMFLVGLVAGTAMMLILRQKATAPRPTPSVELLMGAAVDEAVDALTRATAAPATAIRDMVSKPFIKRGLLPLK